MHIGGEYDAQRITLDHFTLLAQAIHFSPSGMRQRVVAITESMIKVLGDMPIQNTVEEDLSKCIKKRCR
jgi:hypothetical protein